MRHIRKYWIPGVIVLFISILYFGLRLPNLTLQPIFADEAIYVRWAQVMRAEPTLRFLPMTDGKTPLYMWILIPMFHFFEDPLYAGRLLSIISGYFTLLGVLFLGWRWFSSRVGLVAAFLIATTPFMVFFDRMALVDSMLTAFFVWTINLAVLLMKYPRIDLAMCLGYFLGGGVLVKPPGLYSFILLPLSGLLFNFNKNGFWKRAIKVIGLWLIALAIGFGVFNILRLGPGFSTLNSRNQDYVFSLSELKGRPLDPFIPHIYDLTLFLTKLATIPLIIFGLGGLIYIFAKWKKVAIIAFLWGLLPLLGEMFIFKTFTARYILFFIPSFLFICAVVIGNLGGERKLKNLGLMLGALIFVSVFTLPTNYLIVFKPFEADLPRVERNGYFENWTAGYGLKEIADYLIKESEKGSLVVGTEGYFGTLPDGLNIYLDKHSHTADKNHAIAVLGGKGDLILDLKEEAKKGPTYFITNRGLKDQVPSGLEKVLVFEKTLSPEIPQGAITLYRVLPPSR